MNFLRLTSAVQQHNGKRCFFSPQYCYWNFFFQKSIYVVSFGALGEIVGESKVSPDG